MKNIVFIGASFLALARVEGEIDGEKESSMKGPQEGRQGLRSV